MAVLKTIVEVLFRTSGSGQVVSDVRRLEQETKRAQAAAGGAAAAAGGGGRRPPVPLAQSPGDPDHPQNRGRRGMQVRYARSLASQAFGSMAGVPGGVMQGLGPAGSFIGQAVGGAGRGVANAASYASIGAGAAAALAIPVALVAVAAGAAATLGSAGLSFLSSVRNQQLETSGFIGRGAGRIGANGRLGFTQMEMLRNAQTLASMTGDTRQLGLVSAAKRGFGVDVQSAASLLQSVFRRGGTEIVISESLGAGKAMGLAAGRMHEMVEVMTQISEGRAPGLRPIDTNAIASLLSVVGRQDVAGGVFAGKGGAAVIQGLQAFAEGAPFGRASALMAAGLGKGTSLIEARARIESGIGGMGGINAQDLVESSKRLLGFGGRKFTALSGQEQEILADAINRSSGGALKLGALLGFNKTGGRDATQSLISAIDDPTRAAEAAKKIQSITPKTMDDVAEAGVKAFGDFKELSISWEHLLKNVGEKLENVILPLAEAAVKGLNAFVQNDIPTLHMSLQTAHKIFGMAEFAGHGPVSAGRTLAGAVIDEGNRENAAAREAIERLHRLSGRH